MNVHQTSRSGSWVLLALALALTSACGGIPIPVSNPEPFQARAEVRPGSSTREDVVTLLGKPHLEISNGRYWVYGRSRIMMENIPPPHQHDYYGLLVAFEGDIASRPELASHPHGPLVCWTNRLCLDGHWVPEDSEHGPMKADRRFSAVVSRGIDNQDVQAFTADPGACSVFVYREFDFFQLAYPPTVTVGELNDEPVPATGYLYTRLAPGEQTLRADNDFFSFDCEPAGLVFIAVSNHGIISKPQTGIERVPEKKGRDAVRDRYLLLTW